MQYSSIIYNARVKFLPDSTAQHQPSGIASWLAQTTAFASLRKAAHEALPSRRRLEISRRRLEISKRRIDWATLLPQTFRGLSACRTMVLGLLLLTGADTAQAYVGELDNMYVASTASATSFQNGSWYIVYTASDRQSCIQDNGSGGLKRCTNGVQLPTTGSMAWSGEMPSVMFKATTSGSGFTLMSGEGHYLRFDVTSTKAASVSLVENATNATPVTYTTNSGTNNNGYYNLRSTNTLYTSGWSSYYAYLTTTPGAKPLTQATRTRKDDASVQIYIYKVTLAEKHSVTYHYVYDANADGDYNDPGDQKVDVVSSAPLAIGDALPAVTLPAALAEANFELDPTDSANRPSGKLTSFTRLEWTIKVRPKATAKTQEVYVRKTPIEMFINSTIDLEPYVYSTAEGVSPTFTYRLVSDGSTGATLAGSRLTSLATPGTVSLTVKANAYGSSANPETWFAESPERDIIVHITSVPTYVLNFQQAFDDLAAYTDVIGATLGKYTLSATVGGDAYDNMTYLNAVALYGEAYKNIKNQTEASLTTATNVIRDLLAIIRDRDGAGRYTNLSLNLPQPGTLLRLQETATLGYYYTCTDDNDGRLIRHSQLPEMTADANNIFYYYNTGSDVAPNMALLSYRNGLYMARPASGKLSALASQGTAPAGFSIADADRTALTGRYAFAGIEGAYLLEEVSVLPVSITAHEWATLYCPTPLVIPSNLQAYVETAAPAGSVIPVTRILGTVPAGTCLILHGREGTYNFSVTQALDNPDGTPEAAPNVVLRGTYPLVATSSVGSVYTLQPKTPAVGFYPWAKPNITHFKAYHLASASGSNALDHEAAGFSLLIDGGNGAASALLPLAAPAPAAPIYDIHGRYCGTDLQPLPAGIYLQGGKKVKK